MSEFGLFGEQTFYEWNLEQDEDFEFQAEVDAWDEDLIEMHGGYPNE